MAQAIGSSITMEFDDNGQRITGDALDLLKPGQDQNDLADEVMAFLTSQGIEYSHGIIVAARLTALLRCYDEFAYESGQLNDLYESFSNALETVSKKHAALLLRVMADELNWAADVYLMLLR